MPQFNFQTIGVLSTIFTEKFGVPRQSGMVPESRAILKLKNNPDFKKALAHLEDFSHLWILFVFHKHQQNTWKPMIRPPREDAPKNIGVFASRSPHRPNPIGMSAVKLDKIDWNSSGGIELHLSNVDFLDQTPVLDIKPYLPFADNIKEAHGGWAHKEIPSYEVLFSINVENFIILKINQGELSPQFTKLLTEILKWDPRPLSLKINYPINNLSNEGLEFALRIMDFEVKWIIKNKSILVFELLPLIEYNLKK